MRAAVEGDRERAEARKKAEDAGEYTGPAPPVPDLNAPTREWKLPSKETPAVQEPEPAVEEPAPEPESAAPAKTGVLDRLRGLFRSGPSAGSDYTRKVSAPASEILGFLIADVRGYTSFTQTHGDEAAARLGAHSPNSRGRASRPTAARSSSCVETRRWPFLDRRVRRCAPLSSCSTCSATRSSSTPPCRSASASASMRARPSRWTAATEGAPSTSPPACAPGRAG